MGRSSSAEELEVNLVALVLPWRDQTPITRVVIENIPTFVLTTIAKGVIRILFQPSFLSFTLLPNGCSFFCYSFAYALYRPCIYTIVCVGELGED